MLGGTLRWLSQLCLIQSKATLKDCLTKMLLTNAVFVCYLQAIIGIGLISMFPVVGRSFASFAGEGSISMMNYAWRLSELPLGMVVSVLSIVLLPKLSEMHASNDDIGFSSALRSGLTLMNPLIYHCLKYQPKTLLVQAHLQVILVIIFFVPQ